MIKKITRQQIAPEMIVEAWEKLNEEFQQVLVRLIERREWPSGVARQMGLTNQRLHAIKRAALEDLRKNLQAQQTKHEIELRLAEAGWCVQQADHAFAELVYWSKKLAKATELKDRTILNKAFNANALAIGKSNLVEWFRKHKSDLRKDLEEHYGVDHV